MLKVLSEIIEHGFAEAFSRMFSGVGLHVRRLFPSCVCFESRVQLAVHLSADVLLIKCLNIPGLKDVKIHRKYVRWQSMMHTHYKRLDKNKYNYCVMSVNYISTPNEPTRRG